MNAVIKLPSGETSTSRLPSVDGGTRRRLMDATVDLGRGWPVKSCSEEELLRFDESVRGTDWSESLARSQLRRLSEGWARGEFFSARHVLRNRQTEQVGSREGTPYRDFVRERYGIHDALFDELWSFNREGIPALPHPEGVGKHRSWSDSVGQDWIQTLLSERQSFGGVIVVPRFGIGGGEKVANATARALREKTGLPTLLLVADTHDTEDHDPNEFTKVVCLGRKTKGGRPFHTLGLDEKTALLAQYVSCLSLKHLVIINSSIATATLARGLLRSDDYTVGYALFSIPTSSSGVVRGFVHDVPWIYRHIDHVLTDNATMRETLGELCGDSLDVQVLDIPTELAPASRSYLGKTVLWASRLDAEKRVDLLIEIASSMPDTEFRVYGSPVFADPSVVDSLRSLANVDFRGPFSGFSSLDRAGCATFLYTSSYDGMPNIVLEAMAAGMAIVASDVGGVPSALADGRGVVVDREAPASDYVESLRALAARPLGRALTGHRARAYIRRRHTPEAFTRTLSRFLDEARDDERVGTADSRPERGA